MDTKEWTELFIRNKDVVAKKLVSIDDRGDSFECTYKDARRTYLIREDLSDEIIPFASRLDLSIVCLNKRKNVSFLAKHWDIFVQNRTLMIIFSNPATNSKWIINPSVHDSVAGRSNLSAGLMSLASAIDEVQ